jgi:hypothetical protein
MSDTDTLETTTTLVDTYLAAFNETDPGRRAELLAEAFATGAYVADPLLEGRGHDGLAAMAAQIHTHYPDHRLQRSTGVDRHHDVVRFGWELVAPDGAVVVAAVDVGIVAPDGRLARVAGFFGDPPALEGDQTD